MNAVNVRRKCTSVKWRARIFSMAATTRTRSTRERNPRGQGERLRAALIDAAIELLADLQDGDALSVRAVTARAGVTPTALYLHFADRDELLAAVKERCFTELRQYVLAAEAQPAADSLAQAEAMCVAYLQFAADLPGHYHVLFHTRRPPPSTEPAPTVAELAKLGWPPNAAESFDDLVRGMQRCLPDGRDAFQTATMVWAGLHGYASLRHTMLHFPMPAPHQFVKQLLDAHLHPA
jgi:AcrR family transcriptional regulator